MAAKGPNGLFFGKAAQPRAGHFFRDLPGREDATFHQKVAGDEDGDMGETDDQIGSAPPASTEMGGGMYGSGSGKKPVAKKGGALKQMLAKTSSPALEADGGKQTSAVMATTNAAIGAGAKANGAAESAVSRKNVNSRTFQQTPSPESTIMKGHVTPPKVWGMGQLKAAPDQNTKTTPIKMRGFQNVMDSGLATPQMPKKASAAPSDWESDAGINVGFHRPASEQPEGLEVGGERFHSTLAKSPSVGADTGPKHGLREGGSMSLPASAGSNLGKHASPRFLGTPFGKSAFDLDGAGSYIGDRLSEAKDSLMSGGKDLGATADSAIRGITHSPVGAGIAALVGAKLLGRGAKGVGRGAKRLFRGKAAVKPGILERAGHWLGGGK